MSKLSTRNLAKGELRPIFWSHGLRTPNLHFYFFYLVTTYVVPVKSTVEISKTFVAELKGPERKRNVHVHRIKVLDFDAGKFQSKKFVSWKMQLPPLSNTKNLALVAFQSRKRFLFDLNRYSNNCLLTTVADFDSFMGFHKMTADVSSG